LTHKACTGILNISTMLAHNCNIVVKLLAHSEYNTSGGFIMLTEERKKIILQMLEEDGIVKINQLAEKFDVSIYTIRRDLTDLEKKGLLKKTHGGAVKIQKAMWLPTIEEGEKEAMAEKKAIAKKASEYIEDGDTIFLIGSMITRAIIPYIFNKKITVVTNSIDIGKIVCQYSNIETIIVGGRVKNFKGNILGGRAISDVNAFYFDKSIIPCAGIESKGGVTTSTIDTADFTRAVISSTMENIVVADYRKIGRVTFSKVCDASDIKILITDEKADKNELDKISKKGVSIETAVES